MTSKLAESVPKTSKDLAPDLARMSMAATLLAMADGSMLALAGTKPSQPVSRLELAFRLAVLPAERTGGLLHHPDGMARAIGHLLLDLAASLSCTDAKSPVSDETRFQSERRLEKILAACAKAGVEITPGPDRGLPRPQDLGWCARRVRRSLALRLYDAPKKAEGSRSMSAALASWSADPKEVERVVKSLPLFQDAPSTPEEIARALEEIWLKDTAHRCPVLGEPLVAAIRDLQAREFLNWPEFDASERARQVVMACLTESGEAKPSKLFDAERKRKERKQKKQN